MEEITKIELQNFQSHKHTVLELALTTAFVGESNSGKSSVERALSWLFYNIWDPGYPQNPDKATGVAIVLKSGTVVARYRTGDKNRAVIRRAGQEPEKFKQFGDEIPGVFDLINTRVIQVNKRKINLNFSRQGDSIFMIGESRPSKAHWLGRLYGAHVINSMLRLMGSDRKELDKKQASLDKELTAAMERLKGYDDLPDQEASINAVMGDLGGLRELQVIQDGPTGSGLP
jgi:hypothetical protein